MPGYRIRKRRYAKKKTYRRKRLFKRMRKMRNYTKADGGHLEKITKNIPLVVSGAAQFAQCTVNWMATGASMAEEVFFTGGGVNADAQFQQCSNMYREYYVSSFKIEYRPLRFDLGNGNVPVSMAPITVGTAMDRLNLVPIAPVEFRSALDSKLYDPNRSFKRFYRVAKYANTKLIKWRSTTDALTGATGLFYTLPNCQTTVHMPTTGFLAGSHVADLEVTYYVKFRGRIRA